MTKRKSPALALILAIGMLIVGIPVVPTTLRADWSPTFTLDICHPAQALGTASAHCMPPLPSAGTRTPTLRLLEATDAPVDPLVTLAANAPDPPPPKS